MHLVAVAHDTRLEALHGQSLGVHDDPAAGIRYVRSTQKQPDGVNGLAVALDAWMRLGWGWG